MPTIPTAAERPQNQDQVLDQLHSMPEGARRLGISLPKFKAMARSAEIETVQLGRRRLVAESTLQAFIANLLARGAASNREKLS
jgi:excisionase family DNA binding protein